MAAAGSRTTRANDPMEAIVRRYSEDKKLEAFLTIPPHMLQLRYNMHYVIRDRLARNIKNRCTEQDGFVLGLKRIAEIRGGVLDKRSGSVHYAVDYIAQTLRPEIGDVVEAIVSRVFKYGVFADLGPLNIFVPLSHLPQSYEFYMNGLGISYFSNGEKTQDIKPGSEVHIKLEQIEMLDDNFMPDSSTKCVLKAMGELVGAKASYASVAR